MAIISSMKSHKVHVENKLHGARGEYIGRPSPLGNPFEIDDNMDRSTVISKYKEWFYENINDYKVDKELERLKTIIENDGDVTLVCWCAPSDCHGHVIKEYLEQEMCHD
jgi:hypothetical protein